MCTWKLICLIHTVGFSAHLRVQRVPHIAIGSKYLFVLMSSGDRVSSADNGMLESVVMGIHSVLPSREKNNDIERVQQGRKDTATVTHFPT